MTMKLCIATGFVLMLLSLPASAQQTVNTLSAESERLTQAEEPIPARRTGVAVAPSGVGSPAAGRAGQDLSPWSMFMAADVIVKAVMIALTMASLATWTLLIGKTVELFQRRRTLDRELARIAEVPVLAEAHLILGKGPGIMQALIEAAQRELRLSGNDASAEGIKERAASSFGDIQRAEGRAVRSGMGILATIGSISPFVGLFGTVWGIMNSFIGISKSQTTNLAVVAPGIAEALLATAIGLVAAIPAVIVYNHFSRATKSYLELVSRGAGSVGRLLSRDLDRGQRPSLANAAE